jgi:hypothetical protein
MSKDIKGAAMTNLTTASTNAPSAIAPSADAPRITTNSLLTYRYLRHGLVIIAFALPPALYLWGWILLEPSLLPPWPQTSMSFYYHYKGPFGNARDVFVGALCAIGVFLILYQSDRTDVTGIMAFAKKRLPENRLLNFAGVAACLIALFPMSPNGDCDAVDRGWSIHSVHGFVAAAFFIAIALVCCWYPAKKYKGWSIACAVAMAFTIGFAVMYYLSPKLGLGWKSSLCQYKAVFWMEAIAVYAFGLYWCLKSADESASLMRLGRLGDAFNSMWEPFRSWWDTVTSAKAEKSRKA